MKMSVKADLGKLKDLEKTLLTSKNMYAKIGIIGSEAKKDHDGITNVELGLKHEFGSNTGKIPERSFLRMPIKKKRKKIAEALEKKQKEFKQNIIDGNIKKNYQILGIAAEAIVQEAFETGGFGNWQKLSPYTIARKGSSAILIDTAQLRKSISSKVVGK
jgi:phage gpG-like protein